MSDWENSVVNTNDDATIDDEERELRLTKLFAEKGYTIHFVD